MLITSQSSFLDLRYHDGVGCRGRLMSLNAQRSSESQVCVARIPYRRAMPSDPHRDKELQMEHIMSGSG